MLVPPMSKLTASANPHATAIVGGGAHATRRTGQQQRRPAPRPRRRPARARPPTSSPTPRPPAPRQLREVRRAHRFEERLDHSRDHAFVLAELRAHLVRAHDELEAAPRAARPRRPARGAASRSACNRHTAIASTPSGSSAGSGRARRTASSSRPCASSRPVDLEAHGRAARAARAGRRTGRTATGAPGGRSRSRRRSPRVATSATRAPRRSSSAFVATVVPCASTSTRARPDRASSIARSTAACRIVGSRRDLRDAPVVGDDVGERAAAVDPEPHSGDAT